MPSLLQHVDVLAEKKYTHYGKTTPPDERFWSNTNKDGPIHPVCGQCWVWMGKPSVRGYGRIGVNYQRLDVHRYSYELNIGPLPDGMCVLHKCDNPMCVNPDHLFAGTRTENMEDKVAKGRQTRGEGYSRAKLTDEAVRYIRANYVMYSKVRTNAKELARMFGVGSRVITDVVKGKYWKHVV